MNAIVSEDTSEEQPNQKKSFRGNAALNERDKVTFLGFSVEEDLNTPHLNRTFNWFESYYTRIYFPIESVVFIKSQKSRDEGKERIDSVLQVLENRNISNEGKENFWPNDLSVLFREFVFGGGFGNQNGRTFRIPGFFFLPPKIHGEELRQHGIPDDQVISFNHQISSSIDESFLIRFLTLGLNSVLLDSVYEEEITIGSSKETPVSQETNEKGYRNALVKKIKDLFIFLHFTGLRLFEIHLICNLQSLVSTAELLQIFEDFLIQFGEKKELRKNNQNKVLITDEDEEEDTNLDMSKKLFDINFKSGFVLGLFWEIFRRRNTIRGDVSLKFKLHKLGYFFEIECMEEGMIKLEKHPDYSYVFENLSKIGLVSKEQLREFSKMQAFWMNSVVKYYLQQPVADSASVILSTSENSPGIKISKLFLMLFSNFFSKMFRYDMEMKENSNQGVQIEGFASDAFVRHLLGRYFICKETISPNIHCLLETLLHFVMYNENILSFETEMDLVFEMNRLSSKDELLLKLLEVGFKIFDLPEFYHNRIFRNVKLREDQSESLMSVVKCSLEKKRVVERAEEENEKLRSENEDLRSVNERMKILLTNNGIGIPARSDRKRRPTNRYSEESERKRIKRNNKTQ